MYMFIVVSVCERALHCVVVCYSVLQCVTICCSVMQRVAACCSALQCDAATVCLHVCGYVFYGSCPCIAEGLTATHCNTL